MPFPSPNGTLLPQACSQGNAASPRERLRSHQERPSVAAARSEGLTWSGFKAPVYRPALPVVAESAEPGMHPVSCSAKTIFRGTGWDLCPAERRTGPRALWTPWELVAQSVRGRGSGAFRPARGSRGFAGLGAGQRPGNPLLGRAGQPPAGTGAPTPCWPPRWRFYDFTQLWCLSTESKIQTPVVLYAAGFLVRNSE